MFIKPIEMMGGLNGIRGLEGLGGKPAPQQAKPGYGLFQDILTNAVKNASDADKDLAEKQYLQSIGQIEDVHTVPIAAAQAELSMNLLVQLRNKALDAYNELMRMSV